MNRLEKRHEIIKEQISLYDVCLDLRMSRNGSADPLPMEKELKYVKFLETVLETWELDNFGSVYEINFDFAVRNLIVATLDLYAHRQDKTMYNYSND
jgi:hypothetical protein